MAQTRAEINKRYRESPKGRATYAAWAEANQQSIAERKRQRYQANRDENNAKSRKWYQENRERARAQRRSYGEANRDKIRAHQRRRSVEGRDRFYHLGRTHGLDIAEWWAKWEAQDGKCYLCGCDLDEDPVKTHVDHHHGCRAHSPKKSCRYCQRGLACALCNHLIGLVGDDPSRLRHIADALEAANLDVEARQANAPEQLGLDLEETA